MKKNKTKRKVGYAFVVCDILHFGHLYFLRGCKKHCDFLIVGVYTDELTETYKRRPLIPFAERIELIKELKIVDMVVTVHNKDCTPMLKKLTEEGWKISHLFHSTDWMPEEIEGKNYIESIGGTLIQPEFYEDRSTTSIIKEILRRHESGEGIIEKQNRY